MAPEEKRRLLEQGRLAFNRGDYYQAHEQWEEVWLKTSGDERLILQGLIQIATALHKFDRGRPDLCHRLLGKGLGKLAAGHACATLSAADATAGCLAGMDIKGLFRDAAMLLDRLSPDGTDRGKGKDLRPLRLGLLPLADAAGPS
jgi:hypothetical protein